MILEAFWTHGLLLADNGSNWYFTGGPWWLWLLLPLAGLAGGGAVYLRTRSSPATSTVTVDPSS